MKVLLKMESAKLMAGVVEATETLVEEASVKIAPDEGLSLAALDPAKTAMVQVFLPRDFFAEFDVEDTVFVGVNFTELARILKRAKRRDGLEIELLDESRLAIRLVGDYRREFILPTIAGEPVELRRLKVEFTAGIRIDSKRFPDIVKDLKMMGAEMEIYIDQERAEFKARSERGESVVTIGREDPVALDIWADQPARSLYSMAYLERLTKPASISPELTIEIASDRPLKMFYSLGGIEQAGITYYLANMTPPV
ncbi:MAG: hypothetical protein DRO06_01370 [Thermoproteota archaeon]|nr:MAG: hypothetical protein DRO06_01370 [Candidatus Korarchaeota archaeon]